MEGGLGKERVGEHEGAGATVQGVGWRVTMEMAETDPRVIWGQKVMQEMGLGGANDTKVSSFDH